MSLRLIILTFTLICTLFHLSIAFAKSRYPHPHQDIFNEQEIQLGLKGGPQFTKYSTAKIRDGSDLIEVNVGTRVEFVAGAALKFIYGLLQIEIDLFYNQRGWVTPNERLRSVSIPMLLKLPMEIYENIDIAIAAGYQPDFIFGGAAPHHSSMHGLVAGLGFSIDFAKFIVELEGRYNHGLRPVSDAFEGAYPRELQILVGPLWHF